MTEQDTASARPKNIMVVTGAPEDLDVLKGQLGDAGYELVWSPGPEEALEMIWADSPDVVLLDVESTGAGGAEFCEQLRSRPETEAVPVIAITRSEVAEQVSALDMGADGLVIRPFRRGEVLSRVRTLLRMKELHDKVAQQNKEFLDANARLDVVNRELLARNRELEQGMNMAHRLQMALLPQKYPRVKNIGFSHTYAPAEAIGGDVFQIIGMSEGRAAIFISDVSGHGVRAALVASIVKTVIDYIDLSDKTPTDALKDFNSRFRNALGSMSPQIYATGVLMMLDGDDRTVAVASAGHPCPLLVSKERMSAEEVMDLDDTGPALGFVSDPEYPTVQRQLSTGDILLAFTDGAYEVVSEEGEMFGLARMQKLVADNTHLIPRDLIQRIVSETDEFMGTARRPDDVCLVAAEVY